MFIGVNGAIFFALDYSINGNLLVASDAVV
jgi:hypothetical protein